MKDIRLVRKGQYKFVEKSWGHEIWIVNSSLYCGKELFIRAGHSTSQHFHVIKTETLFAQSGRLHLIIWENAEEKEFFLDPGDSFLVNPGLVHRLGAPYEDVILYEFSTEHFDSDSNRITK